MSNDSVIAAIKVHHAQMAGELRALVDKASQAADADDARATLAAGQALASWCHHELLPHAAAEETTIYRAGLGLPETMLLVQAMMDEHRAIERAVSRLDGATGSVPIAEAAVVVQALFDVHLPKENDLLLPVLDAAGADLDALLADMHHLLGE